MSRLLALLVFSAVTMLASTHAAAAPEGTLTFALHYSARRNGEWKNASADRGGNHGDITGAP